MAVERVVSVKRTIWTARCKSCEFSAIRTEAPAREVLCQECRVWVPFVEESYTGPDFPSARDARGWL